MRSPPAFSVLVACVLAAPTIADVCTPVADLGCTNYGSVDLTTKAGKTASAAECCAFCKEIQGCGAWTLTASGQCTAKKRCQETVRATGAISGFTTAPYPLPPDNVCSFGLTFKGANGTALNLDVLGASDSDLDLNVQGIYYQGSKHLFSTKSDRMLHRGCAHPGAWCHDADVAKYAEKWVFVDSPGFVDLDVAVAAVCRSGCPDKYWLKGQSYQMVWELTGELDPAGFLEMSATCCPRKAQQCDVLHADPASCKEHCNKHNIGTGIVSPSCGFDACCEFVPNNPDFPVGSCECNRKPPPSACAHGSQQELEVTV